MCVIAYKAKNVRFMSQKNVRDMWNRNPDGAGIMWRDPTDNDIHFVKGFMKLKRLEKWIEDNRSWLDDVECALHFRITTHGGTNPGNCHPFVVRADANPHTLEGRAPCVLMHNGILSLKPRREDISDTAELALRLGENGRPKEAMDVSNEQYEGNRIILMDANGTHFFGDAWNKSSDKDNEGILYSNLHFEHVSSYGGGGGSSLIGFGSPSHYSYVDDSYGSYGYYYNEKRDAFVEAYTGVEVDASDVDPGELMNEYDYDAWCYKMNVTVSDEDAARRLCMPLNEYMDVKTEAESFGESVEEYMERTYGDKTWSLDPEEAEFKMAACS